VTVHLSEDTAASESCHFWSYIYSPSCHFWALPHQSQQRCTGSNQNIASCHSEQQTFIDFLDVLGGGSTKNAVSLETFSYYSYFFLKGSW